MAARHDRDHGDLEQLVGRQYQHGFVTDTIESETVPRAWMRMCGARLISRKKGEPDFLWAAVAAGRPCACHWSHAARTALGCLRRPLPADRLSGDFLLLRLPKAKKDGPKSLAEVDPEASGNLRQTRRAPARARATGRCEAVDAVFDSVSVATTFKERLSNASRASSSLLGFKPRPCALTRRSSSNSTWAAWCRRRGQLLRGAEFGGVLRRLLSVSVCPRACVVRWNCPRIFASMRQIPVSSSAR